MKHEKSCGIICCANKKGKAHVLLICHRYGSHWAFPKGHVERGETEEQTAIREVREETGAEVEIVPGYREVTTYSPAKGVTKDVVFFVGGIKGGSLRCQPEEVRSLELLPVEQAAQRLTYEADKHLLEKAKPLIEKYFACPAQNMPISKT